MGESRWIGVRCSQMVLESEGKALPSPAHENAPLLASPLHPAGGRQLSPLPAGTAAHPASQVGLFQGFLSKAMVWGSHWFYKEGEQGSP